MTTYQDKVLKKCMKQFDGMTKIDAYDILHKIETLLIGQESPIEFKSIEKTIENSYDLKNILPINSSTYCYLEDECYYINVYTFKSKYPPFLGGGDRYFTLRNGYKMFPFDNKHIEEVFESMNIGYIIREFLKENNVRSRNPKTNRFLLLELFDQIDPPNKMI